MNHIFIAYETLHTYRVSYIYIYIYIEREREREREREMFFKKKIAFYLYIYHISKIHMSFISTITF